VKTIYSSDLARAVETVPYATLWAETFETDERLREIYLGKDEVEHYDFMSPERKAVFNEMAYTLLRAKAGLWSKPERSNSSKSAAQPRAST
jgi:broad specificity phosphatase PhoE